MKENEIIALFKEVIEQPDFKELAHVNKQQLYNYRHRIVKLSLMIEILFKVGAIKISRA